MRSIDREGNIFVCFVGASSKLSPRAATTMPRMELNAAVEASKAASGILHELRIKPDEVYLHTDSKIVLGYLHNKTRRFNKYVQRRVNFIKELFSELAPQIDKEGIIRVGGRLKNSNIEFSIKHPILIPEKHPLSIAIITHFNKLNKRQGS